MSKIREAHILELRKQFCDPDKLETFKRRLRLFVGSMTADEGFNGEVGLDLVGDLSSMMSALAGIRDEIASKFPSACAAAGLSLRPDAGEWTQKKAWQAERAKIQRRRNKRPRSGRMS